MDKRLQAPHMSSPPPPTLPRETRDTLFILGVVALVLLPQVTYLPLWASALTLSLLGWRFWLAHRNKSLPGKWPRTALLALAVGSTLMEYRSIVGLEAGVALLVLLLALKTLEMRARRDAMVIFFLCFFTLLTLFLRSQSLSMAMVILLALWGLLAALVNAHMPAGYPSLRQLLRTSGLLIVLGTPVMVLLFLGFPRWLPFWGLPSQELQGRTGLSSEIAVGQVAELAHQRSVAMRVRFDAADGSTPPQRLLYFRGPVLSEFDGRHWKAQKTNAPGRFLSGNAQPATGSAQPVGYEVFLEPHQQRWLLTLEATLTPPETAAHQLQPSADLQWLVARPVQEKLRYRAQAHLHYIYGQSLNEQQRSTHLLLPQGLNPRTLAWARQLRTQYGSDDTAIIQAALTHLRQGSYVYTLQPGTISSPHTADDFWFDRQRGFCEHIASAFAVLMRAAGIPARLVAGYQGGERNPVDGLWTVRQSDAHAWTEVWLPREGWMRIDPTSAIAPARAELLQQLPASDSLLDKTVTQVFGQQMLQRLRASWEAIDHRWNDGVLNYSPTSQDRTMQRLAPLRWNAATAVVWFGSLVVAMLCGFVWWYWRRQRQPDPWLRLMVQARRQLRRVGIVHADSLGLQTLARTAQAQWGDESQPLQQWLLQMEQWRYAPHGPQTPTLASLRRQYRALKWPRPRSP